VNRTSLAAGALGALALRGVAARGLMEGTLADQLRALAVPIANGVQSFPRSQVGKVVESHNG
jgi:hypothetical protein